MTVNDPNVKIRATLNEIRISRDLDTLHRDEHNEVIFLNEYDNNFRILVSLMKDVGYKFRIEYFLPGLGSCVTRCNNIIGRHDLAIELVKSMMNIEALDEYTENNSIKDILDMEIDSIKFLPQKLIDKDIFGDIFAKFDEAIEEVFGRKKFVTDSIKSDESA